MQKYVNIYKFIIVILVIVIVTVCGAYRYAISPVSKESKEIVFVVPENSTYLTIATKLKESGLIRSEIFYKVYIKIFNPNNLQAGTYELNQNMSLEQIIDKFEKNEVTTETLSFVIPEGKHIEEVASIISTNTGLDEQGLLNYWQDEEVIKSLINKYWFLTNDIKKEGIRYYLEGYLFPDTYQVTVNPTNKEVTYKMLDRMDQILSKYKEQINNSKYSVHEILTLASIVEHEAVLDEDRPIIAGVFLNRLEKEMMLQSCATIGYAIDEWKLTYTYKDLNTDSPYNTYMYYGLPIGPGDMPGEASIKAVLYPDDNDYLYFLANVYSSKDNKTYYSKTYKEHQNKCLIYLGKSC